MKKGEYCIFFIISCGKNVNVHKKEIPDCCDIFSYDRFEGFIPAV